MESSLKIKKQATTFAKAEETCVLDQEPEQFYVKTNIDMDLLESINTRNDTFSQTID